MLTVIGVAGHRRAFPPRRARGSRTARLARGLLASLIVLPSLLAYAAAGAASAAIGDAWATPSGVSLSHVATGLRVDGAPVDVRAVRADEPPGVVLARWRAAWTSQGAVVRESRSSEWHVISTRVDDALLTVQLRAMDDGAEGFVALARSAADAATTRVEPALPMRLPSTAALLRSVESRDGARVGTQYVLSVRATAGATLEALTRAATAAGWMRGPDSLPPRPGAFRPSGAGARAFTRGNEELLLFVMPRHPASYAVLHHLRAATAPAARE